MGICLSWADLILEGPKKGAAASRIVDSQGGIIEIN